MIRYVSILALGIALSSGFSALPLTFAHAAEDGVSCEKQQDQGWIDCTVKQDSYSVSGVSLNGGTCPSPVPTDEEAQLAKRFNNRVAAGDQKLTNALAPMMNIQTYFSALCLSPKSGLFPNDSRKECPGFLASLKAKYNPIGNYKAADHFKVATFECDNVVEMTIRTNDGTSDTWTFAADK